MFETVSCLKIGVISDTHGLLRPEAVDALQGSELIIHAGDIGKPEILDTLQALAPLHSIRGNIDTMDWAKAYPETLLLQLAGKSVYVLHDVNALKFDPVEAGIDIVISGHSHNPKLVQQDGVTFLNPGSAGPRRFKLPVSVAIIEISNSLIKAEIIPLELS